MAEVKNNTAKKFDVDAFLTGAYYAPLTMGEHKVTLGVATVTRVETSEGDQSYITIPMTFENGRVINNRWYNIGLKIALDQLRRQLADTSDYKSVGAFLKALKDKQVSVWISSRTYTARDGEVKSTLQYDFAQRGNTAEEETNAVEEEII